MAFPGLALVICIFLKLSSSTIPVIDLGESDEYNAQKLFYAVTEFGFFYITNHGISADITQDALTRNKQLFDLELSLKESLSSNSTHWGYLSYQRETTDTIKQTQGDTKECFLVDNNANHHEKN